jgi:hypothetical protein
MWFVCVFHVAIGAGLNVSLTTLRVMAQIYGAQVDWTPQFVYILKPLGAFMCVLGLLAAVAARDPLRYGVIVYGFAMLFVIRGLQRLVFREEIVTAFAIAPGRNLINMAFFLGLGSVLFGLYRVVERQSGIRIRA